MLKICGYIIVFLVILGLIGFPALTYIGPISLLVFVIGGLMIILGIKQPTKTIQGMFAIVIMLIVLTPLLLNFSSNAINGIQSSVQNSSWGSFVPGNIDWAQIIGYAIYGLLIFLGVAILVFLMRWRLQLMLWRQKERWKTSLKQPQNYGTRDRVTPAFNEASEGMQFSSDHFPFSQRRSLDIYSEK